MLKDPRWDKQPTLASFALFVASKDPTECYDWSSRCRCAVGQWLASIGMDAEYAPNWGIEDVALANIIASASRTCLPLFKSSHWNFGALADRILAHQRA